MLWCPSSWALNSLPMMHSHFAVVLVTVNTYLPFMILPLYADLERPDPNLNKAAMDLGLRPRQVMRDVTLPVISPAILSGRLLAFTISLDDAVITEFTTGPGNTTLPLLIRSEVKLGVTPGINALATIMVVAVGIGVALAGYILHRARMRRARDARMAYRENAE